MTTTDPIADMLTRIRNGIAARHPKVDVPASRLKGDIAKILKDEGYIANYKLTEDGSKKLIRIYLKYTPGNMPVISRIERVSRPGCRVYVGSKDVPRVLGGLGINILTTPRGVMTGGTARKEGVGGEVIWHGWKRELFMPREGNKPIPLPKGVKITLGDQLLVEGPKGKQTVPVPAGITLR